MSFRARTKKTYMALKEFGKQSLSQLAKLTGHSKSSTHRQQQSIENRIAQIGTDFFETEVGLRWLTRLILAALFIFGLQANVGAERIALFFVLINISCYVGLSAATINRLENKMRELCKVYEKELMPALAQSAKQKELIAGADETFFERLLIINENLIFTGEDSPMANLLLSVMGAFAEFERALIRERQLEGIALAKKRGAYKGRKRLFTLEQIQAIQQRVTKGEQKSKVAQDLKISRETLYQYLKK